MTLAFRYLEMSDWDLEEAIRSAKEDGDWEQDVEPESGNIHITVKVKDGIPFDLQTTGAGLKPQPKTISTKPVTYDGLPAIATKNVRPQDIYDVSLMYARVCIALYQSLTYNFVHGLGVVTASRFRTRAQVS
jgi:hypothetical protein